MAQDTGQAEKQPTEYNAPAEYQKYLKETAIPGNIPREVMGRIQAGLLNELMSNKELRASGLSRHAGVAQKYIKMTKVEKLQYLQTVQSFDVLVTLKLMEDDVDCLDFLVGRMREMKEAGG